MTLRIATRASALAQWQAEHVAQALRDAPDAPAVELVLLETSGDRNLDAPLWEIGGKGVFVKEVQAAVLDGRADLAVHSAKDLPALTPAGLVLAAIPERGDPRDALIGSTLAALPAGAVVATGSVRRRVQLAAARPDLTFAGIRGNIQTRLDKADAFDAVVMAVVALERLGLSDRATEVLDPSVLLPQVGQGALAVECRADDEPTLDRLAAIEHAESRLAVDAERGFLAELGGDCDVPAAAHAVVGGGHVRLEGLLASLEGHVVVRHAAVAPAETRGMDDLGRSVARHLLDEAGGRELVDG